MSTHKIPFSILKKKITLNYPKSAAIGFCSKGLKNKFETAIVNEPSVFKPLKFYCTFVGCDFFFFYQIFFSGFRIS